MKNELREAAKAFEAEYAANPDKFYPDIMADFAMSEVKAERERIAKELEAICDNADEDSGTTQFWCYADNLRGDK